MSGSLFGALFEWGLLVLFIGLIFALGMFIQAVREEIRRRREARIALAEGRDRGP